MLKQAVTTLARRMGYTIIPNWQLSTYEIVNDLKRRFALFKIDLVIDVGANSGQYRDLLRERVGYTGPIASFEPIPELARKIAERAKSDLSWDIKHMALGSTVGHAEFNIMAESQFSSLLAPRQGDGALFQDMNKVTERVTVAVSTLDTVLPALLKQHNPRGVFLKIDTQGFDLEVLRGGRHSLPLIAALQTEASVHRIYDQAPGYQEVIDFLQSNGFTISGIFPNNEGMFPRLVEFDCHFVRNDLIPH